MTALPGSVFRPPETVKLEWTSRSVRTDPMAPGSTYCASVGNERPFKIRWLIVTTPGFRIRRASVGNVTFVDESATDLYFVRAWEQMERLGQLDRVRIDAPTAQIGNNITIEVTNENQFGKHRFECGFIGEQLAADDYHYPHQSLPRITRYGIFGADDFGPEPSVVPEPIANPLILDQNHPENRECPECGAPAGTYCFGVKRGMFHKRREKDKHR